MIEAFKNIIRLLSRGSLLLCLLAAIPAPARAQPRYLYIQPLGEQLPDEDVALVREALVQFYGLEVKLLPRVALPTSAFYPPRKRYRADQLLDFLEGRLPADGDRILGLTGVDISTTKGKYPDWGVLGLGTLEGRTCVISSFRARKKLRDRRHGQIRLAKVAVHELGHTLGLEHCPQRGCLMEDAQGQVATSDREYDLCPRCRALLRRRNRPIPAAPAIPWPRP